MQLVIQRLVAVLLLAGFTCSSMNAQELLNDAFSVEQDVAPWPVPLPHSGWTSVDFNAGSWGPLVVDSNGAMTLSSSGPVPHIDPPIDDIDPLFWDWANPAAGWAAWGPSLTNPAYGNGRLRTKVQVHAETMAVLPFRVSTAGNYWFRADGTSGTFGIAAAVETSPTTQEFVRLETIPGVQFESGEDWWMEAAGHGDHLSLKVWKSGEREPATPQLAFIDTRFENGWLGVGAAAPRGFTTQPLAYSATFDDVSFSAPQSDYSRIIVFGDSLSDVGNVGAPPIYAGGRYTNDLVWAERLADQLGIERPKASRSGGANYAFAGGTTGAVENTFGATNVDEQISQFLNSNNPDPEELFAIWAGPNDVVNNATPTDIVMTISAHISTLAAKGAKHFLVPNMPAPTGEVDAQLLGPYADHNRLLAAELDRLRTELDVAIFTPEIGHLTERIIAEPAKFGFIDVTTSACSDCGFGANPSASNVVDNPNDYYRWDDVHPSGAAHVLFANEAFASLSLPGDVRRDGAIDVRDIDAMATVMQAASNDTAFDLNNDGSVDIDDRIDLISVHLNTYIGDSNLDGEFNSSDFVSVLSFAEYEDGIAGNSTWTTGDWNGDGDFDTGDFLLAFQQAGYEKGPRAAVNAVPEPSAALFVPLSLFVFSFTRRSKRNQS